MREGDNVVDFPRRSGEVIPFPKPAPKAWDPFAHVPEDESFLGHMIRPRRSSGFDPPDKPAA